jgi:hypothetical protein
MDNIRKNYESGNSKKNRCKIFGFYGTAIGLGGPTVLSCIYYCGLCDMNNIGVLSGFIMLFIIALSPPYIHLLYGGDDAKNEKVDKILYTIGTIAVIVTAYIVFFTGGMKHSFLSFYFLYMPSVIAIAFDAHKGLLWICITGALAVIAIFMFSYIWPQNIPNVEPEYIYIFLYVMNISIQFIAIYLLECENKTIKKITKQYIEKLEESLNKKNR